MLTQALAFPGIVLPAFIATALLLAIVLRHKGPDSPVRYRDLLIAGLVAAIVACLGHAAFGIFVAEHPGAAAHPPATASLEVDMKVSEGNVVDVFLNDWTHPPERVPVIAAERHVYRFPVPTERITLMRLDPTDRPKARIEIYRVRVMRGEETLQDFHPGQLKAWTLVNLAPPKEEAGALVLESTNDDPILWIGSLDIPIGQAPPAAPRPSTIAVYARPLVSLILALVFGIALMVVVAAKNVLPAPLRPAEQSLFFNCWMLAAICAASVVMTLYLQRQHASDDVEVQVDMTVSSGRIVEMWLNDWRHPAESAPVVAGQRHVYQFHRLPQHLLAMRLDPTEAPDARIVLYGIAVKNSGQVLGHWGPAELKGWARSNVTAPKDTPDGGIEFLGSTNDPMLVGSMDMYLPSGPLSVLSRLVETTDAPFLLAVTAIAGLLLLRMRSPDGRRQAVVVALTCCVILPVVAWVLQAKLLGPPGVRSSVGYAAYEGYPKANEYLAVMMAMSLSIAVGLAIARLTGRRATEIAEAPDAPSRRMYAWIAYAGVFGLTLLYFLPDLLDVLRSMPGAAFQRENWDTMNWLTWDFMLTRGLRPMRDFWFPYTGSYIDFLPAPAGVMYFALHYVLTLSVLYWGFFRLTGRRVGQALVLWGLIASLALLDIFAAWHRYVLSVDMVLFYIAVRQERRWEWTTHLPFALFTGYVFFYEPTQVFYPGLGIAVDTALAIFSGLSVLKERILRVGVPMLAGIAGALTVYAANGMWTGFWDFERSLGDQADYGGLPADIDVWVRPALQPNTVFLMLFLLTAFAAYRWLRSKDREQDALGAALIVMCFASYLAMQKQVLRPHSMTQMRVLPFAAILIFGLIAWRERRPATRAVVMVFLGCVAGVLIQRNLPSNLIAREVEGPHKVVDTVDALLHKGSDFQKYSAAMYTRPHFAAFQEENAVVDHLIRDCGWRISDRTYVLGDASIFYMLLDQAPPYVSNSYNNSPISEQEKVVAWLQQKKPRFVIWPTDTLGYDTVPHVVRLPLIYTYVVDHYAFERAIGPYHVLIERPAEQPIDVAYWKRVLGDRLDLGHVPALARESAYEDCGGDTAQCDAVALVRYAGAVGRGKSRVTVEAQGQSWGVDFDITPAQREYVVNLERLWFWDRSRHGTVRVSGDDGAQVEMRYRREKGRVLY